MSGCLSSLSAERGKRVPTEKKLVHDEAVESWENVSVSTGKSKAQEEARL